jgi:hypothetical protein
MTTQHSFPDYVLRCEDPDDPTNTDYVPDYDKARLVVTKINKKEFEKKGSKIETCNSEIHYMVDVDGEDVEHNLLVIAPTQTTFGPDYNYEYGATEEDKKDPTKATGVQMKYPLTSFRTVDHSKWPFDDKEFKNLKFRSDPTPAEAFFRQFLDDVHQAVVDAGLAILTQERKTKTKTDMPAVTRNSFNSAKGEDEPNWFDVVKRPYGPSYVKDSKPLKIDPSKALYFYAKLVTEGKKDKMRVKTAFYMSDSDDKINPLDFKGLMGDVRPAMSFSVYWGGHNKNPHGASIKPSIVQAGWETVERSSGAKVPSANLCGGSSKAKVALKDVEEDDGGDDGEELFKKPKGKPSDTLKKAVGKAAAPTKSTKSGAKVSTPPSSDVDEDGDGSAPPGGSDDEAPVMKPKTKPAPAKPLATGKKVVAGKPKAAVPAKKTKPAPASDDE